MSVDPHLLAPDHDVGPYGPPVDGLSGSEVSSEGSTGVALPALHQLAQGEELEKTTHNIDLFFFSKSNDWLAKSCGRCGESLSHARERFFVSNCKLGK